MWRFGVLLALNWATVDAVYATPYGLQTTRLLYCVSFAQVEEYDPFIDTLDYIFHTKGVTANKVRQVAKTYSRELGIAWLQTVVDHRGEILCA